jgi:hypothetical protein
MRDFDQWLRDAPILVEPPVSDADAHILELEEAGVINVLADGLFEARCRRCGEWTELPVGPDEIDVDYQHYCGGSPRCCP